MVGSHVGLESQLMHSKLSMTTLFQRIHKIQRDFLFCLAFAVGILQGCSFSDHPFPYDLENPASVQTLSEALREISDLTVIDSQTVACIQDEEAIIYYLDIRSGAILQQVAFGDKGDFEGIAYDGAILYVLRSDGALFAVRVDDQGKTTTDTMAMDIPQGNYEGLCYDEGHHRLLIARKSKLGKGRAMKDKRGVFSFDLRTQTASTNAVYVWDVRELQTSPQARGISSSTKKQTKTNPLGLQFGPSAIAIHPISKLLYVLSAVDGILFVFDENGGIVVIKKLPTHLFNKAEGITFQPNGDMLITNEGGNGHATLLRFRYQP